MRCTIVPPFLLSALADAADAPVAARARASLELDEQFRRRRPHDRAAVSTGAEPTTEEQGDGADDPAPRRRIRDAEGTTTLPGRMVRREGEPRTDDAATDEAYRGLGATYQLFQDAYERDSLDGSGMPLRATVHYGEDYANAFWDGTRMVFGDGDGEYFKRFTVSIDIIGHELAHGVTEHTADLVYSGQSGALNESVSDVFGSLVKQRVGDQTADEADWLIGAGLFTGRINGDALRSMKAPGTAYDDPLLGKDPQPGHMDDYVDTTEDNGGVHINSGIPNRAFYLAATAIGGNAWKAPGEIWYAVLTGGRLARDADFATFAGLTTAAAAERHGESSPEHTSVAEAWSQVGLDPS